MCIIQTLGGAFTVNVTATGGLIARKTLYAQNVAEKVMSTRIVQTTNVVIIANKGMKPHPEIVQCLSWRNLSLRRR